MFNAAYNSGTLFFVIACASILGWAFAMMQVPQQVLSLFQPLKAYPWLVLLIMNIFLLWMGMWLDVTANILLFAPILAPSGLFDRHRPRSFLDDLRDERKPGKYHAAGGDHPFCDAGGGQSQDGADGQGTGTLPPDQNCDDFFDYLSSLHHPLAAAAFRLRHRRPFLRLIPPILDILVKSRQ